jgi:hypothetical protein
MKLRRIDAAQPHPRFDLDAGPDRNPRFEGITVDNVHHLGGITEPRIEP